MVYSFSMYLHNESLKTYARLRLGVLSQQSWASFVPFRKYPLGSWRVPCPFTSINLSYFVAIYMIIIYTRKLGVLSLFSWWILVRKVLLSTLSVCVGYTQAKLLAVVMARGLVEGRDLFHLLSYRIVLGFPTTVYAARSPSCRRYFSLRGKPPFALTMYLLRLLGVSTACSCRLVVQVVRWSLAEFRDACMFEDDARAQSVELHQHVFIYRSSLFCFPFSVFTLVVCNV